MGGGGGGGQHYSVGIIVETSGIGVEVGVDTPGVGFWNLNNYPGVLELELGLIILCDPLW